MLKVVIVVLFIATLASLGSGLVFMFKDADRVGSKRTLYALGVRVTLAVLLMAAVFYGFYTGQLTIGSEAPWHAERHPPLE